MRWPWERVPWGRGRGAGASDSAAGDADTPSPGSAHPPAAEPFRAAPATTSAAWTHLPALQRTVSDTTAVAPPAAFRSSLTTHQNPSFLGPLGHLVDRDGPVGVVGGLTSSVGGPIPYEGVDELRVPDRPTPPAPPVQRRIATLRPDTSMARDRGDVVVPTDGVGHDDGDSTEVRATEGDSVDPAGSGAPHPAAPEPAPLMPLVVARSAESALPIASGRAPGTSGVEETGSSQAPTIGARDSAVTAAGGSSPAREAAATAPESAPARSTSSLTVPVQRSDSPSASSPGPAGPTGRVGDVTSPATLRPVAPTSTETAPAPATAVEPAAMTTPAATAGTLSPPPAAPPASWWWRGRRRSRRLSSSTSRLWSSSRRWRTGQTVTPSLPRRTSR